MCFNFSITRFGPLGFAIDCTNVQYVRTRAHTPAHAHVRRYAHICTHTHTCACTCTCTCTYTHRQTHTHHVRTHRPTERDTHTLKHAHTNTHTHTRTRTRTLFTSISLSLSFPLLPLLARDRLEMIALGGANFKFVATKWQERAKSGKRDPLLPLLCETDDFWGGT